MDKDYLDELIEENKASDPEFAEKWKEVEAEFRLLELRKKSGLTQEQVAARLGVARPRIAEIERHPFSVSFGRLLKYMNAIGADVKIIAPGKEPRKRDRAGERKAG
jgi:DNA-binding XRE family transcriptional regulator